MEQSYYLFQIWNQVILFSATRTESFRLTRLRIEVRIKIVVLLHFQTCMRVIQYPKRYANLPFLLRSRTVSGLTNIYKRKYIQFFLKKYQVTIIIIYLET